MGNPVTTRGFKQYHAWLWEFVRVPLLESWAAGPCQDDGEGRPPMSGKWSLYWFLVPYVSIYSNCMYCLFIFTYYLIIYTIFIKLCFTYHSLFYYMNMGTVYSQTFSI